VVRVLVPDVMAGAAGYLVAGTLLWAGVAKMRTWNTGGLAAAALLPSRFIPLAPAVGALLPIVEIGIAAAIVVSDGPAAFLASSTLFAGFLLLLVRAWGQDLSVSCNCFGFNPVAELDGFVLLRTLLLFLVSISGLFLQAQGAAPPRLVLTARTAISILTAFLSVLCGALLISIGRLRYSIEPTIQAGLGDQA